MTMSCTAIFVGICAIQYFSCKAFAESKPSERLLKLKEKGFCVNFKG